MTAFPGSIEVALVLASLAAGTAFLFGIIYFAVRLANRSK